MINLQVGGDLSEDISKLIIGRLTTKIHRGIKRSLNKTSVMRDSNGGNIVFPVIASADINRDSIIDYAKYIEVRIAYAIKTILDGNIRSSAHDVTLDQIVDDIPFSNVLREDGTDYGKDIDIEMEIFEESIRAMNNIELDKNPGLEDISSFGIMGTSVKTYTEAPLVITDRRAVPTAIEIEVKYINDKRGEIKNVNFTFTVEAIPRKIDETTLINKFKVYDNKRFYKKYVQLTNKEITFVKDFLLDFEVVKREAKAAAKGGNIFTIIEKSRRLADMGVNIYPFASIMVSEHVARELESTARMDLRKEYPQFMKKFFATSMAIYDADTNIIDLAFDGDKVMGSYPFDDISMDTSKVMKELRTVVKMNR